MYVFVYFAKDSYGDVLPLEYGLTFGFEVICSNKEIQVTLVGPTNQWFGIVFNGIMQGNAVAFALTLTMTIITKTMNPLLLTLTLIPDIGFFDIFFCVLFLFLFFCFFLTKI